MSLISAIALAYLRGCNWMQICLMGCYQRHRLAPLVEALHRDRSRIAL